MSHVDVLRQLTTYVPQVIGSVFELLDGKEEMRKRAQNFINGWIMLCTSHRHYHLVELFADEGYLLPYSDDT